MAEVPVAVEATKAVQAAAAVAMVAAVVVDNPVETAMMV